MKINKYQHNSPFHRHAVYLLLVWCLIPSGCHSSKSNLHPEETNEIVVPKEKASNAEPCTSTEKCIEAGEKIFLKNPNATSPDWKTAFKLYTKACAQNSAHGCSRLATLYELGIGVKKDRNRSTQLKHNACEMGSPHACFQLGTSYKIGDGVDVNHTKALELYNHACDGGSLRGCDRVAETYLRSKTAKQQLPEVIALYRKSCDQSNGADFCYRLANMHAYGQGGDVEPSLAAHFYERALEGVGWKKDDRAAIIKLLLDNKSTHIPTSPSTAQTNFTNQLKECNQNNRPPSCLRLALMMENAWRGAGNSTEEAIKYYNKLCQHGHPIGCRRAKMLALSSDQAQP